MQSISGLAEKKMPQFSSHLAHENLHARAAVSNETVAPGLPNARAIGTGAKLKILREYDLGKWEQGKALGWKDALLLILKSPKRLLQAATNFLLLALPSYARCEPASHAKNLTSFNASPSETLTFFNNSAR
ncbi:MAG: hypothetical protein KAX99_02315 [Azonexus sp.]|nr:hypothetical protein [Azonexus sp.]